MATWQAFDLSRLPGFRNSKPLSVGQSGHNIRCNILGIGINIASISFVAHDGNLSFLSL